MSYWTATDDYVRHHGGGPPCPSCGKRMFAADDHGRFTCFCGGGTLDVTTNTVIQPQEIPQVDTSSMTDEEKAEIPAINRLREKPTAAEAKVLSMLARGPDAMDDPEYWKACKAVDEEKNG